MPAPTKNAQSTEQKQNWKKPVLSTLKVEEAESGTNNSENGATGS